MNPDSGKFIIRVGAGICCFLVLGVLLAPAQGLRPNVLWITCEDMSAHLPAFGDSTVKTPNLDRLAAEGIRYTNLFSTSGVCAPSRSAIITGMYPTSIGTNHMRTGQAGRAGLVDYEAVPPPYVKAFPEYRRASGYYCTNNNKTDYQIGNPFTVWDENGGKAHWRSRPRNQPFFAVFNIIRTHESQIWVHRDKPLRVDPAKVPLPPYYPNTPVIRRDIARYYDNIMVMDSTVGVILDQPEKDNLLQNTIIFFFSDHGAGLPWYKRELYDRDLKAPLIIVRFPDRKGAGTVDSGLVSFIDMAPTVLSLSGIPVPEHMHGKAFLGKAKASARHEYIFAARDRIDELTDMVRAVSNGQYKYIRNYQPGKPYYQDLPYRRQMDLMKDVLRLRDAGQLPEITRRWFGPKAPEELYDTRRDPYELHNLAADPAYQPMLLKLRNVLNDWTIRMGDKGFMAEKDMLDQMWPGANQPATKEPIISVVQKTKKGATVTFGCETEGASIAYKVGEGNWVLCSGSPVSLPRGAKLTAKAVRYGYKESGESTIDI